LSYLIQVSEEGGAYAELPQVLFGTNQYLHLSLTGGFTYTYSIKAINKYGQAVDFSEETMVLTGEAPERILAPTTQITDIYVVITWIAPFENYLPITSY
jgi:hypothetical protein